MITTPTANNVERQGIETEQTFKIKASAKAFSILSSGLYSDKKTAILRETLTNAMDAQTAAHNHSPVLVHLPNRLEPWLSIRDFGTGLSHESVLTIYTTYFESTKTESNDFTGCLGLGSKSPFSYVDSFTVVSFFDSIKRTYNAFIDQNGVPSIALLTEEETTEANGMDIIIPVKSEDMNEFRSKLEKVTRRFKIQPKVIGNPDYVSTPVKYTMQGTGWGIRSNNSDMQRAYAVMGNIGYPITLNDSLSNTQKEMLALNMDMEFNIGDLDIAASREGLSFDAPTIANIKARLDVISAEAYNIITNKFTACKTMWEARCLAYKLFRSGGECAVFEEVMSGSNAIKWQGKDIDYGQVGFRTSARVVKAEKSYNYTRRVSRPVQFDNVSNVKTNEDSIFILNDLPKGTQVRVKNLIGTIHNATPNRDVQIYIIYPTEETLASQLSAAAIHQTLGGIVPKVAYPTPAEQVKEFCDSLGIEVSQVQNASSLPTPPKAARKPISDKSKARVLLYELQHKSYESSNWEPADVDLQAGGVYIVIDRYNTQNENGFTTGSTKYIEDLTEKLSEVNIDISDLEIYGVKTGSRNKFDKAGNWVTLSKYVETLLQDFLSKNDAPLQIANMKMFNSFESSCKLDIGKFEKEVFPIPHKTFAGFVEAYKTAKANVIHPEFWENIANLCTRFKITLGTAQASINLKDLWEIVEAEYPMFKLMAMSSIHSKDTNTEEYMPQLLEYIKKIDC